MSRDDTIRFRHMLGAAQDAVKFARLGSREELEKDHLVALGLVKCVEIIGEAASRVDKENRNRFQNIPWRKIIAMGNRLVHGYFDIDLDQVWKTVTEDIPPLVEALEVSLSENRE